MDKRFSILAVDDDPVNIQMIRSALKGEYEIFTALNGYDAFSQLKEHMPDLILLDVMMPDLSGFDVCKIIKAHEAFADIPVIFLTALDTNDGRFRGLELGGIDYLTKPINLDLLKLRVRNHIALKQRNDLVKEQRDLLARQKEELAFMLADQELKNKLILEAEENYRTLFSEMLDGFALHEVIFDAQGKAIDYRFLAVNPAFELLTGLKAEEIIGRTVLEVLPDTEPYWIEAYCNVTLTGESASFKNFSGGVNKHFDVKAFRHAPNQFACIFVDISEQVSIEEDLAILVQEVETRNRFFESVISNLQSGIIVVELDFHIRMVNSYVTGLCAIAAEEFIGRNLDDICPELYQNALAGKTSDELLVNFCQIQVIIGYTRADLSNADGETVGYIIAFKDLTEIVRIRKELRQKERLSSMGEVVARVAHEMRNPLFGMTAAAQILEMELNLEPNQQELMNSLLKESRRLNNLVEELLDTTRETRINKARVNLISILDESLLVVEAQFYEKNSSLRRDYHGEVWLSADLDKMKQVIINLVTNALDASRPGGFVSLDVTCDDNLVFVTVKDNGEGIPPEILDTIFDVFYTTKKNGTGMGLSICRGIVEAHGGTLTASNNPEGGAKFVMQLPLGDCQV